MDTFWRWFVHGSRAGPRGFKNIINTYLFIHGGVAAFLAGMLASDPMTFAQKALFPASSILVGLSMAWSTRAATILQSKDLRDRLFSDRRPAEDYVYGFQLSILVVMTMLIDVAIMSGGGFRIVILGNPYDTLMSAFWMYFLLSLTLRECWGVVNATSMLSILEYLRTR